MAPLPAPELGDRQVRAVTLDCWNTLLRACAPDDSAARRLDAVVRVTGADPRAASAALDAATAAHVALWEAGRQHGATGIASDMAARLDLDAEAQQVLARTLSETPAPDRVVPTPHAREVLAALSRRGVALGLVCDTGLIAGWAVRQLLSHHGLTDHLEVLAFSDEVGVPKPHPRIFGWVLERLGVAPERAVHVGDLQATDVAGARGAGMGSIRYAGVRDEGATDDADHVIGDFTELLALIPAAAGVSLRVRRSA
jgi:putative hydrolase of the HAD superfamily